VVEVPGGSGFQRVQTQSVTLQGVFFPGVEPPVVGIGCAVVTVTAPQRYLNATLCSTGKHSMSKKHVVRRLRREDE